MRIISVDPGTTSGVVIAAYKPASKTIYVISHGEVTMDDKENALEHYGEFRSWFSKFAPRRTPIIGLIEGVVKSGHLSNDKYNQILSYDRASLAILQTGGSLKEIQPSINKRAVGEIPTQLKGDHVRDAYRLILSHIGGAEDYEVVEE